jgi:SAM-dependent methyltransferase
MNSQKEFLSPSFTPNNLDRYLARSSILRAFKEVLPRFSGTLLDVGCGLMPYKTLVLQSPSQAQKYIGLDLVDNGRQKPDLIWDGQTIPLDECSIDCAMLTEVLEHCPEPEKVIKEILRVLKPGGLLFLTVPFFWTLHEVPHDEYRYTPFALERHLKNSGFAQIKLEPLGGWDASLAQMLGLWVRRRLGFSVQARLLKFIFSIVLFPIIWFLIKIDSLPKEFSESTMITGLSGTAIKPYPEKINLLSS